MSQRMHRRYMRVLLAWILVLVALVAAGNWLMDPFGLFGSPDWQGFNRVKPEIVKNDRPAKAQMIERQRPTALILGNSRSLNGIPTDHRAWNGQAVFNGAFTAGYLGEALEVLKFAHDGGRLKRVLLNIDELNYRAGGDLSSRYDPRRYRRDFTGTWVRALDRAQALTTDYGLRASYRTWKARHGNLMESDAAIILPDGSVDQDLFFSAIARRGGAREAFARVERQAHLSTPRRSLPGDTKPYSNYSLAEATLLELLRFCRKEGIEISIFLPPAHVRSLAEKKLSNSLDVMLQIRRSVLDSVRREAIESEQPRAPVFDFLQINNFTEEAIPPFGDEAHRMTWFFEGSHFTQHFGEIILSVVYSSDTTADPQKAPIATALSEETISTSWRALQSDLRRWMESNPDEIADLRKVQLNPTTHAN